LMQPSGTRSGEGSATLDSDSIRHSTKGLFDREPQCSYRSQSRQRKRASEDAIRL